VFAVRISVGGEKKPLYQRASSIKPQKIHVDGETAAVGRDPARSQPSAPSAVGAHSPSSWPDADRYWGAMVNVNGYVTNYIKAHPSFFADVKMATDLTIAHVNFSNSSSASAAKSLYEEAHIAMTGLGIITGNYISGSNVIAIENQRQYPYQAVQRGQMPPTAKYCGTWPGQSWRSFICVTDAATRKVFHDQIRMQWESIPAPLHLVDNAASYEGGPLGVQPWADQCANMKEINAVAQSLGQKVVFNVAWVPHQISAMDMATLVDALKGAGISSEQPFETYVSSNSTLARRAIREYRQLLDAGIAVVMIAVARPGQATAEQLASWVSTWRRAGDSLYLSQAFWKKPDPKAYWLPQPPTLDGETATVMQYPSSVQPSAIAAQRVSQTKPHKLDDEVAAVVQNASSIQPSAPTSVVVVPPRIRFEPPVLVGTGSQTEHYWFVDEDGAANTPDPKLICVKTS
jgi:hypothetical protein